MNWSFVLGEVVNEPTNNNVAGDSWKLDFSPELHLPRSALHE